MERTRVGIIGTGFGAKVHLPAFLGIPEYQVLGIASQNEDRSKDLASQHALPKVYSSYEQLIADEEIDLVVIATPPMMHRGLIHAALRAPHKAILCEKPFTCHPEEAEALVQQASAQGIICAINFEFRELASWKILRHACTHAAIGEPRKATFSWCVGTWVNPERPWSWQCDRAQGGGVMSTLGVHLFDAASWLFGPVQSVWAECSTQHPHRQGKAVTSEDGAFMNLVTTSGIPIDIHLSNVDPHGRGLSMHIIGDLGELRLHSVSQDYADGLQVQQRMNGKKTEVLCQELPGTSHDARIMLVRALALRLLNALRSGDRTFQPSWYDGLKATMIRDAAIHSTTHRARVELRHL